MQPHADNSLTKYLPLIILVGLTILIASAKQEANPLGWNGIQWMHDFMGMFFILFSMFKLFDVSGFAHGFQMYDLVAKAFPPYAYIYPFLELALGLGYLSFWNPPIVYGATFVIMFVSLIGVIVTLKKGLNVQCACLGTTLQVPLSTITLLEDSLMALMALGMLFLH